MSTDAEQQAEEIEVLHSIYDGYENFKQVNPITYQYKYGEGVKSFILQIIWGPTYPSEKPTFNLDIFYNQHLLPSVKEKILSIVDKEAEKLLGSAMTFSIFEELKDKVDEILEEQTEEAVAANVEKIVITEPVGSSKKPDEKYQNMSQGRQGREARRPTRWRGYGRMTVSEFLSQSTRQLPPN